MVKKKIGDADPQWLTFFRYIGLDLLTYIRFRFVLKIAKTYFFRFRFIGLDLLTKTNINVVSNTQPGKTPHDRQQPILYVGLRKTEDRHTHFFCSPLAVFFRVLSTLKHAEAH